MSTSTLRSNPHVGTGPDEESDELASDLWELANMHRRRAVDGQLDSFTDRRRVELIPDEIAD